MEKTPERPKTITVGDFGKVGVLPPTVAGQAAWRAFFDRVLGEAAGEPAPEERSENHDDAE